MLLTIHRLLEGADAGSIPDAIAWASIQTPVFMLQGLLCVWAGSWAFRAHAREAHRAAAETTAQAQRFALRLSAGQGRILTAMRVELERTRLAYDRAIEREWTMVHAEVGKASQRIAIQLEVAEERFGDEHDRVIGRFNEALVDIQRASMAAARIAAHKSAPKARRHF